MTTRRDFFRQTALFGAGLSISPFFIKAESVGVGANDKIGVGLIGCNGTGSEDLKALLHNPEVECIALSDVDESVSNNRAAETEKITGKKVKHLYKDWCKLIDNKNTDLVIVGTPDRWHCLQMVSVCQAGKDVYCEKPPGNSIEECNIIVRAVQKYNRVAQVGQWQCSDPHWQDAMQFAHSGQLGKIRTVCVFSYQGWYPSVLVKPDETVPAGVDHDMRLGPVLKRPFDRSRFHFTFRWFRDYVGGLITDWGVYLLDYALCGMNVTVSESIMASGGKFGYPDNVCEASDLLQTIYTFKDFIVTWDYAVGTDDGVYGQNHGLGFIGENGTLVIDRGSREAISEKVNGQAYMEAVSLKKSYGEGGPNLHAKDHLGCIKSRNRNCNISVEIGAHITRSSQLGNIAYRIGKGSPWDGKSFHDVEADRLLCKEYRVPWELPKI